MSTVTSTSAQLKHLNTTRTELAHQLAEEKQAQQESAKRIADIEQRLAEVEKQIKQLTENVVVSEHAILRYCERVLGINLDEIREKIMPEHVAAQVRVLKNGTFPVGSNGSSFRVLVKNRVAVTILTKDEEPNQEGNSHVRVRTRQEDCRCPEDQWESQHVG